ncbi:MAG: alpha/beta fold hydrolase [Acidobacteriia bacterium]|nr:alpha/beta fold hydrolase [Terriglobia bacterium]
MTTGTAAAQSSAAVRAAAIAVESQKQGPGVSDAQRQESDRLEGQAQRETQTGRFSEALRDYAHALAVLRNASWTPVLELASSIEARVDHVMLDIGQPVTVTLASQYRVTSGAQLSLSVFLVPHSGGSGSTLAREICLARGAVIEAVRLPFSTRLRIPETAPGAYSLELRLAPLNGTAPDEMKEAFLKTAPLHIENLASEADQLRGRLAGRGASQNQAALAGAEYVLRFFERVDRGEESARRFVRYSFRQEFETANVILDELDRGRNPFQGRHGDFRRAYRSALDGTLQPYRLFVPDAYDGSRPFPLVIALHGAGGDENDFFDSYQEAPLKREVQRTGFLVVCPKGRGPSSGYRGAAERDVFDVWAEVRRDYRVDPDRVYILGHSMGAFAAWRLAAQHPDLFAGLGLIAGGGEPEEMPKLRDVPQYVVHGVLDDTVPVSQSRAMAAAARKAGADVVYIELPEAGHYNAALGQFGPMLDFFRNVARRRPR